MMTLPSPPNRLYLLSFLVVVSVCAGLITGAVLWVLVSPLWSALGAMLALLLVGAGLLKPRKLSQPYIFWNNVARKVAQVGQLWVAGIYFYTVFLAVGSTGTPLGLARPQADTKSLWISRETLTPSAYIYHQRAGKDGSAPRSWISSYVSWAAGSRNLWACCLLPFLLLLKALDTQEGSELPDNIYTLF